MEFELGVESPVVNPCLPRLQACASLFLVSLNSSGGILPVEKMMIETVSADLSDMDTGCVNMLKSREGCVYLEYKYFIKSEIHT